MTLRQQIEQEIRDLGPMPFSRYMERCLYDPTHGYYAAQADQFGKAGDFYTASDVHAVFGRLLARQFDEMWRSLDRPHRIEILELGPGRGLFARDVLDWSKKKLPDLFAALTYTLQESSAALRARLDKNLAVHLATGKAHVATAAPGRPAERSEAQIVWGRATSPVPAERTGAPGKPSFGLAGCGSPAPVGIHRTLPAETPLIVFANEFFDALPVEILSAPGKLHLALEAGRLREIWLPPSPQELEWLDRWGVHPEGHERIEVCLPALDWARQIARAIHRGFLLAIDYGYTREQQLAGHHRGTLMAYRQHSASPDPYQAPGEQDLTAHVNFTALMAAAVEVGMDVEPLQTQSHFLLQIGEANQFADAFEDCASPQERAKVTLQLKHLVTPAGMGETFQVMLARRL